MSNPTIARDPDLQKIIDREMNVQAWERQLDEAKEKVSELKEGFNTALSDLRNAIEEARTGQRGLEFEKNGPDQAA